MSVFCCGGKPGAWQSTVPHESCGEQANEVSRQMKALSWCPREAMAQRVSCRVLSVLCVCPALSATKGSLARQRRGIRWTRPLLPTSTPPTPHPHPDNCELEPLRDVNLLARLVGSCPVYETLTNKCHFIRFTLHFFSPVWLLSICLSLFSVCIWSKGKQLSVMLSAACICVFSLMPLLLCSVQ